MPIDDLSDLLGPSPKRSLSDDIAERLRRAIWSGRLAPDERLREEVLADSLGVSRGPIREALSQLEREGLVIKQPNRGAVVARLSPEDLNEVYSLRLAIERLAVQQAVQNAEPKHFKQMQDVIDQMATEELTVQRAATLDVEFHEIVYEAARHKRLYDCWSNLKPQIYIFLLSRNVANPDYRALAVESHQVLLDAIKERNQALAVERIEGHLKSAYERIEQIYVPRPEDVERPKTGNIAASNSPAGES